MTAVNFEAMTGAEIDAALAALRKIKKDVKDAANARYAELSRELVETLLTEHDLTPSEYSARVGLSTPNLTLDIEGRTYTFYVSIKDVKASEERALAVKNGTVVLKKKSASDTEEPAQDVEEPEKAPESDSESTDSE